MGVVPELPLLGLPGLVSQCVDLRYIVRSVGIPLHLVRRATVHVMVQDATGHAGDVGRPGDCVDWPRWIYQFTIIERGTFIVCLLAVSERGGVAFCH